MVGRRGIAATTLRPAGKVDIEGARFDVVSDGRIVEKGTPVVVIRTDGLSLVVAPVGDGDAATV
jgi:membrane-bound serine protease (ClpP class)